MRSRAAGLDSPELDARLLAGHALGLDHTALTIDGERAALGGDAARHWRRSPARRLDREPVARILGIKEFWGLPLRLNDATLVPRPETETLVEASLGAIDEGGPRSRALRIADLGTGSGALLIALLTELPNAPGVGTDVNSQAVSAARGNADRARLRRARAVRGLRFRRCARRPLRPCRQQSALYRERRHRHAAARSPRHDPRRALDGGADGLDAYRAIAGQARSCSDPAVIWWSKSASARKRAVAAYSARGLDALAGAT